DEHERQLRLLSQRHELQGQIAAHNQQIIQYQQQIEQRQQQLLTALAGYALTLPQEDEEDEHERQLRLLSQRHELQGQIAAHNQQIIQYQQ
ncbi:hypothetical protein CQA18_26160, partial [Enterobacter hormaechei]|uniref:hypothetical protein n=1 Tax=Enterobacter hormaechei TaxID=158836 RepID=UPI000BDA66DC